MEGNDKQKTPERRLLQAIFGKNESNPIAIEKIDARPIEYNDSNCGKLARVRPCKDNGENKTFLGFILGSLPVDIHSSLNNTTKVLTLSTTPNPAIFIPSLGKIIFGYESWWSEIESPEELKDIINDEIDSQWYVELLKGNKGGNSNEN